MKWTVTILVAAVILIGLGFALTGNGREEPLSANADAEALYHEGTADMHAFRLKTAITKLDHTLQLDPDFAEAVISRAMAKHRLGLTPEYHLDIALADSLVAGIKNDDRRMLAELRLSGEQSSRYWVMRDSLLTTLEKRLPENIYVLAARASQLIYTGTPEEQKAAWLKLLEVDPNYANAYNMLGYMELNRGDYQQAIEYMQKYAFLAPNEANPHDSLGEVYMVIGEYEQAEKEFRRSVEMQPDFYHSLLNLGRTYLARGQLKSGIEVLEAVRAEVAGSDFEKRVDQQLIETYLVTGVVEELNRMTAIYVTRYPEDQNAAFFRAVRYAYMGRPEMGQTVIDSLVNVLEEKLAGVKMPKVEAGIRAAEKIYSGLVADLGDDTARRVKAWRQVNELQAQSTEPLYQQWYERTCLARALYDDGQPEKALAELNVMLRVNARLVQPLILTVKCDLALGRVEKAQKALKQLQWTISHADEDYPARATAETLAAQVAEAAKSS